MDKKITLNMGLDELLKSIDIYNEVASSDLIILKHLGYKADAKGFAFIEKQYEDLEKYIKDNVNNKSVNIKYLQEIVRDWIKLQEKNYDLYTK
jgi:hypothetical protein